MTGDLTGGMEAAARAHPLLWLVAIAVIAIVALSLKWGLPQFARLRQQRYDIERYRIEVQEKADAALDDRERERIRATQAMTEQQRQNNENTKALTTIMSALQARLEESAARSHEMGGDVRQVKETTDHVRDTADQIRETAESTAKKVDDIHRAIVRRVDEG